MFSNPITEEKVREFDLAISTARAVSATLDTITESDDLSDCVGWFALNMPKMEYLTKERIHAINFIRCVCTKEIPMDNARKFAKFFVTYLEFKKKKFLE